MLAPNQTRRRLRTQPVTASPRRTHQEDAGNILLYRRRAVYRATVTIRRDQYDLQGPASVPSRVTLSNVMRMHHLAATLAGRNQERLPVEGMPKAGPVGAGLLGVEVVRRLLGRLLVFDGAVVDGHQQGLGAVVDDIRIDDALADAFK